MMLTVCVESDLGCYVEQIAGGPGLGVCQVERETADWLWRVNKDEKLYKPLFEIQHLYKTLEIDPVACIIFGRLRYYVDQRSLPTSARPAALAKYWKEVYNRSPKGATVEQAEAKYRLYAGPWIDSMGLS